MPVTNDDRIAAALLRLEQAERLISEARKIFSYAEKMEEENNEGPRPDPCEREIDEDGLYPGQLPDPEKAIKYEDEEVEECLE